MDSNKKIILFRNNVIMPMNHIHIQTEACQPIRNLEFDFYKCRSKQFFFDKFHLPGLGPVWGRQPWRMNILEGPIPLTGLAHCSLMIWQSPYTIAKRLMGYHLTSLHNTKPNQFFHWSGAIGYEKQVLDVVSVNNLTSLAF